MIDNLTVYELFHNTNFFGVCETAADVVAKEVQISDFQLDVGVSVMIKFKYSNSATSPTLNISGSGAIPICLTNPSETSVSWEEWDVIPFTYDGTYWQMTSNPGVKVTQIPTDITNSNFEILFSSSADNDEHIEEARKSKYLKFNPSEKTLYVNDGYESRSEIVTDILNEENFTSISTYGERWYSGGFRFEVRDEISPIQRRAIIAYNNPISSGVKYIRYKIENATKGTGPQPSDSDICIGVKATYDTTTQPTSSDTDWIAKAVHSSPTSNATFEGELRIDYDSNFYLYLMGNNWNFTVTQIDLVSYNSVLNRSYLTNNELGVIKTSNNVVTSLKMKYNDIILDSSGTGNTWDGVNGSLRNSFELINDKFDNINRNFPYWTELFYFSGGTNNGTYTLPYGVTFSDYDFLLFEGFGNCAVSIILTASTFLSYSPITLKDEGCNPLTIEHVTSPRDKSIELIQTPDVMTPVKLYKVCGIKLPYTYLD